MLYLTIAWFCLLINMIFYFISSSFLYNYILAFIDNFFVIAGSIFIVLFGESISRKTPSAKKLIWFAFFIGLFSYSSFLHYFIFPLATIPEDIVVFNNNIQIISFLTLVLTGSFLLPYYLFKIYKSAPSKLKNYTFISFIGGIIFGVISPILLVITIQVTTLFILSLSVGMLIIVSAVFIKNPKLAFILPFKVIRLSVSGSEGGMNIFSHNWKSGEDIKGDDIISAMFQGIITILRESLGKGILEEINLEKAVVIARKSKQFPIMYILIATSTSKSLKNGLNSFVRKFETTFANSIENAIKSGQVLPASEIILDTFSFLPD